MEDDPSLNNTHELNPFLILSHFKKVPTEVFSLTHLRKLHLVGAPLLIEKQLREVPPCIALLINLEELNLRWNNLWTLPFTFTKLSRLRKLDLSFNKYKQLPTEVYSLSSLEVPITALV